MTAENVLTSDMADLGSAFVKSNHATVSCCGAISYYPELKVFAESTNDYTKAISKISIIAAMPAAVHENETPFVHGSGTVSDPYKIYTVKQLNHVRQHTNAHFELSCLVCSMSSCQYSE